MTVELEPGLAGPEAGPRRLAPLGRRLCKVAQNRPVGRYSVATLEDPGGPAPLPGQFYMLAAERAWGEDRQGERPYLARALSFSHHEGSRRDFMIDPIGPGTERLAALEPDEQVWLTGPLGIGFSAPADVDPQARGALLVGGGVGIAPLITWSEALKAAGSEATTLLGFRSADYAQASAEIAGAVEVASDDGSAGHHGFVTELLAARLAGGERPAVYACGPPAMLDEVRKLCASHGVEAQLAMEAGMACGFGACFGCVVRTVDGYRRLCVDGPIVRAAELHEEWE